MKRAILWGGAILMLGAGASAWAGVCGGCGYENPDDAAVCSHCEAVLKPAAMEDKPEEVPEPAGMADGAGLVAEEVRAAAGFVKRNDLDVAGLLYRNALALEMMAGTGDESRKRTEFIQGMITRCASTAARVRKTCVVCKGSGKRTVETTGLDGSVQRNASGLTCVACGGTGIVMAPGSVNDRRARMGEAARRLADFQRGRKYVAMGTVWIPAETEGTWTPRQVALAKRSSAAPCEECLGLGRVACRACEGTGERPCTNRGCKEGRVVSEQEGQLSSGTIRSSVVCPLCRGRATIACQSCRGKGSITCSDCNGSGARDVCVKCDGGGLVACRTCAGSGEVKGGPCPACRGDKQVLCSSCQGDGRKR